MNTVKVGIIGCGKIVAAYLEGLPTYDNVEVVRLADLDLDRARSVATEYGIPASGSVEELLEDDAIELVINLTVPAAHAPVSRAVLEAGKHLFVEKPFAVSREEGRPILELAAERNRLTGCAPDTVLAPGLQTARHALDAGEIGEPVAAVAFMAGPGVETWHPNPAFYYQPGGGPLFDMGPYYLTALINFLGPIRRVSASARASFPTRPITSQPFAGQIIEVNTPTHISGSVDFVNGVICTLLMSFDVQGHHLPKIEIYGSEGTLSVPDPNLVSGEVRVLRKGTKEWELVPTTHPEVPHRGTGVADLAWAIRDGRTPRTDGSIALHVVDAMQGLLESAESGERVELTTTCKRPEPCPAGSTVDLR